MQEYAEEPREIDRAVEEEFEITVLSAGPGTSGRPKRLARVMIPGLIRRTGIDVSFTSHAGISFVPPL